MPRRKIDPQSGESGLTHRQIRPVESRGATSGNRGNLALQKLSFYQLFGKPVDGNFENLNFYKFYYILLHFITFYYTLLPPG